MGGQVGGSGNFNPYSLSTVIPYEGMINENYFRIKERERYLSANLETFKYVTKNPFNKKMEYFLAMLIKSKYDGIGRQEDEIDISVALDISGSMVYPFCKKPTFKELALQNDEMPNNNYYNYNFNGKKRIEVAKECLFKMIDSMSDKVQMALTTFNTVSKMIIPLSPKNELKSISHNINNVYADGGTDLYAALSGAASCLSESTAKFKRVIIITDGWDNNPGFMDLARKLNKANVLITVLSIDSSSNTEVYDKLCELRGCNYYFILNEKDLEKYLISQFNYICFPILYDMKISFQSKDADLIKTIGCGLQNEKSKIINQYQVDYVTDVSNGKEIINTKSLFPSDIKIFNNNIYQEGGLMLLKINPKSLNKDCMINIHMEYTEIEGYIFVKDFPITFTVNELRNCVRSNEIKKGIACYYYTKFYRKMAKFLNNNVSIDMGGPYYDVNKGKPHKKYFDFLARDRENYDMIKIFFNKNYENDLNEYQKEYYFKNLDKWYKKVLEKMNNPNPSLMMQQ